MVFGTKAELIRVIYNQIDTTGPLTALCEQNCLLLYYTILNTVKGYIHVQEREFADCPFYRSSTAILNSVFR
jgi:hypothetical protein